MNSCFIILKYRQVRICLSLLGIAEHDAISDFVFGIVEKLRFVFFYCSTWLDSAVAQAAESSGWIVLADQVLFYLQIYFN